MKTRLRFGKELSVEVSSFQRAGNQRDGKCEYTRNARLAQSRMWFLAKRSAGDWLRRMKNPWGGTGGRKSDDYFEPASRRIGSADFSFMKSNCALRDSQA